MDDNSSQSSGSNASDLQRVWGLDVDEALADTAEAADLSTLVGMIERADHPAGVARGGHGGIPPEVFLSDESDAIQTQLTDQGPSAICAPYIKSLLELISKLDQRCTATQRTLVWLRKALKRRNLQRQRDQQALDQIDDQEATMVDLIAQIHGLRRQKNALESQMGDFKQHQKLKFEKKFRLEADRLFAEYRMELEEVQESRDNLAKLQLQESRDMLAKLQRDLDESNNKSRRKTTNYNKKLKSLKAAHRQELGDVKEQLATSERILDETRQKFDEELRAAKEINQQQPIPLKYVALRLDIGLLDWVHFHRLLTEWEQEWMDTDQEDEKSAMRQKYEGYIEEMDFDSRVSQRDDQILEVWHRELREVTPNWYTDLSFDMYHTPEDHDERQDMFLQEARDVFAAHWIRGCQDWLGYGDVLRGPFGASNIYVRMDDESFTKCKQLYGECPSQLNRKFLVAREFVANSSKGPDGMTDDDDETLNRLFHSIKDSTNNDYEILGGNKFYDVVGDPDIEDTDYFDSEFPYSDRLNAAIGDTGRTEYRLLAFNGLEAFLGLIAYIESHKFTKLESCFAYIAACGRAGISIDSLVEDIPENSEIRCIEKLKTLFSVLPSYVPRDTGKELSSFFAEAQFGMTCDVFHELMGTNEQDFQYASRAMSFSFDKQLHLLNFLHDQWEKSKKNEIDELNN